MPEGVDRLVRLVALGLFLIAPPYVDGDPVVLAQGTEAPGNAVAAGELLVEPPTLINLGFEWSIEGDDNRNATVEVAYRRQGETEWSPALPLLRLQGERIFVGNQFDVVVPNMFAGSILDLEPDTAYEARFVMTDPASSDYNGFGPAPDTATPFRWESPPFDVAADFRAPGHAPALELREFATLAAYSAATGQDRNSVEVGYDVFVNVPALDARDVSTLQAVYDADDLDFRLRPGSAAVDRGMVLPTVTDGFTGSAPDLGALEVGVAAPHYGPRP